MKSKLAFKIFAGAFALGCVYLLAWPIGDVQPVAYEPPGTPAPYPEDDKLVGVEIIDLAGRIGPEDVVVNARGEAFAATLNGEIMRISADRKTVDVFANTGGRPLGLVFDATGDLIVADPFRGLLRIRSAGSAGATEAPLIETLIPARGAQDTSAGPAKPEDQGLCYINNVDVGPDGMIYFTDSTNRFCARAMGGTFRASLFDIVEHRKTGRLMSYNPRTGEIRTLLDGLQFANGVAVSADASRVLVVETGDCRVLSYTLIGEDAGTARPLVVDMPGYPDNISKGLDGRYWIGFTKPRSKLLDAMAARPWLRKIMLRLPQSLYPVPPPFGHVIAIDINGEVVRRMQDAQPEYPDTTGVTETAAGMYIHSLHAKGLAWLDAGD